ncbi:MAG: hypothetical protein KC931_16680 [Candidatus Omnitrophica bacterium]|nr:hypothetical protein [Candidatus Omnitrophota bacterium]MCA9426170.1 hypothetical protein [Candidatus Omnitrophota bacterium]MCA9431405.1 hypothetical protein [Candidatus Omnitrophota bacterium]MCA9440787.1 hypothetical protein [Candidatus Omnitrophota bacterium]MCA9448759.1 hypothetical protein [Candidatus Omnitrophota bacterium]
MRRFQLLFLLPLLSIVIPSTVQAQEERWVSVKIIDIQEGVYDERDNKSFQVTVEVQMVGCERATISLVSTAQVEGKERTWTTNDNFSAPHSGRIVQQRTLLVSEASLRNPPVGVAIDFTVTARGYYKVREMRQVEYIEYVPVTHTTPGYVVPYGEGHRGGHGGGGLRFEF